MKKLCFVVFDITIYGGAERVAVTLANNLCSDFEIYILSLNKVNDTYAFDLNPKIQVGYVFNGYHRIREQTLVGSKKVHQYFKMNEIDVAFIIGTTQVFSCLLGKVGLKTKVIFCDHGALENQLDDKIATWQRRLGAKYSDKTISLTEYNMQSYRHLFKTKPEKIDYIYNSIDDDLLKIQCDYNPDSNRLMSVGKLNPEKGFDMLIQVAELVFKKHKNWVWDIYGDGEEADKLKQLVKEKNLSDNIVFYGNVNDIYTRYQNHAVFVLTSYREGLPLVLIEAKTNKLPIVSFDLVTGPREIIDDEINGYLVPSYDIQMMAEKICCLIENKSLRIKMSENSHQGISKFESKNIMKKWVDIINEL